MFLGHYLCTWDRGGLGGHVHQKQEMESGRGWISDDSPGASSDGGGLFLLWLFGARRPIGSFVEEAFGFRIAFSWVATVLAAVVVSFPLMYRSAKAGFEQIDQNMIEEAKMLGLGKWGILWKILFPCTFPSILSGMILSTTRGLGEYGATAMLAGNIPGKTRTLPLAVYSEVAGGNMDRAAVYVAVILVIAFLSVWVMNMMAKTEQNIKI